MKKIIYLLILFIITGVNVRSQTTAMDFNKTDCSGMTHNFFTELDGGNCVIMEFIMTCSSCINAGHALEAMIADLDAEFPGKIRFYQFAYTNSYTCATMTSFKNTNGFNSAVFDSGAALVAYYGGFGMPTVAVAAGSGHDVLFTDVGFSIGDTTQIGIAVRNFFASTSTKELPLAIASCTTYPNPGNDFITIELGLKNSADIKIEVVDLSGKLISDEFNETVSSGMFKKEIDVRRLSPGFYLFKITSEGKSVYKKFNITR